MGKRLSELLSAGLIEGLGGDDSRFEKIESASNSLAKAFSAKPATLIPAILAGLDPDVSKDDPAISQAMKALTSAWKTVGSAYPDTPVNLLRMMLLDACEQAEEGTHAAIVWLSAADTLPLMRLGKEERVVRSMLADLAMRTERMALQGSSARTNEAPAPPKLGVLAAIVPPQASTLNRDWLLPKVIDSAKFADRHDQAIPNAHHMSQPAYYWAQWADGFGFRMHNVLAESWDVQSKKLAEQQGEFTKSINASQSKLFEALNTFLAQQNQWVQNTIASREHHDKAGQLRLNILWWSEALYSTSLHCGYRELDPNIASIVMAADLLQEVQALSLPTPAAVAYLLTETVNRLPGADFQQRKPIAHWLEALRKNQHALPKGWLTNHFKKSPPNEGRLSLRDLVVLALKDNASKLDEAMNRASVHDDFVLSLPELARAIFRQEQALRIAGSSK